MFPVLGSLNPGFPQAAPFALDGAFVGGRCRGVSCDSFQDIRTSGGEAWPPWSSRRSAPFAAASARPLGSRPVINVQINLNNAVATAPASALKRTSSARPANYTQIKFDTGSPNVKDTITAYLKASGITNHDGLVIEFFRS